MSRQSPQSRFVRNETELSEQKDLTPVSIKEEDQQEIRHLYERIRGHRAKLVGPDGEAKQLPASVYSFLLRLLADLEDGKSVSIVQSDAELTTVEASHLLGMSRQFFVNLLKREEIPFHYVGTHRRVYVSDVLTYKSKRDNARKRAFEDLVRTEGNEGIFDLIPDHD